MKYRSVQEAFADERLYCTSVAALMQDSFGTDWLNWEPETVEMELRASYGAEPSDNLINKAMAVSVLLTTNLFHVSFESWNNIVQVFNFDRTSGDLMVPASLEDITWGCSEARILEGSEEYDTDGFSHDIRIYTGTLLSQMGITKPPQILSFAEMDEEEGINRDLNLAQDEFTFKAYWDSHQNIINELDSEVVNNTKVLINQLKSLPLKTGSTSFLDNIEAPTAP